MADPLSVCCPICGAWPGVPCSKCKRRGCPCGGNVFHAARAGAALRDERARLHRAAEQKEKEARRG